jgi:hypothetical protein
MSALLGRRDQARAIRLASSQPESLPELLALTEILRSHAIQIALKDARVQERLRDVRHSVLTVDYVEDKGGAGQVIRRGEVGIYDYERDVLVVASIDPTRSVVADLSERKGVQPPITAEERDEAIRLLTGHELAAQFARRRSEVVAFPTPTYAFDAEPERRGHRGCTLYVRAGRGRVVAATIDLTARELVPDERLPEGLHSPASRGSPAAPSSATRSSAQTRGRRPSRRPSSRGG